MHASNILSAENCWFLLGARPPPPSPRRLISSPWSHLSQAHPFGHLSLRPKLEFQSHCPEHLFLRRHNRARRVIPQGLCLSWCSITPFSRSSPLHCCAVSAGFQILHLHIDPHIYDRCHRGPTQEPRGSYQKRALAAILLHATLLPCVGDTPSPGSSCARATRVDDATCVLQRGYVIYPKEGPRPPTSEEFYEIARKNKERSAQQ